MAYLLIPNEVDTGWAKIWLAAINENFDPATAALSYGGNQLAVNANWQNFVTSDGSNRIQFQRVGLNGLDQRTFYNLAFSVGGQQRATGGVTTLPVRLPVAGERPFTVLLGSCYFGREDKAGAVGQTFVQLPHEARPDIKILCGDQVYLDNPPQDFIVPRGGDWLQARSFKTYYDTWTQSLLGGGFQELLKDNANFFSSDDHEYWNNAPDRGLNVPTFTLTEGQRQRWLTIARDLFRVFQTESDHPVTFKVGPLSFCNADTRFFRQPAHGNLIPPVDLDAIGQWMSQLDGPGLLVVGQPFFANTGSIKDWGLPDFPTQYERLKQFLRAARHTIVILTGDVHFGRVAMTDLRPELGTKLIEVISSPMQMV